MPELVELLKDKMKECKVDRIKDIPNALEGLGNLRFVGNVDKIASLQQEEKADYIVAFCQYNLIVIERKESKNTDIDVAKAKAQIQKTVLYMKSFIPSKLAKKANLIPVIYKTGRIRNDRTKHQITKFDNTSVTVRILKIRESLRKELDKSLKLAKPKPA